MTRNEQWWGTKTEKGRLLVEEIAALAKRTRAAGFQTSAYILDIAKTELQADLEGKGATRNE
jgi:hypothetical protein